MKNALKFSSFLLLTLFTVFTLSSFDADTSLRWKKLGERKVNLGLDHDKIVVTAAEGVFSKLKLKVRKSGINLHKMTVHFANGEKETLEIRNNIRKGGETRVLDLPGNKRIIREVHFWYDTKGLINNKAVVELWGRR